MHGKKRSIPLGDALREAEPFLRALAIRLCRNESDAQDLVQDTFERALRSGHGERLRNPRAWLAAILHNLFIDRCRARGRALVRGTLDEGAAPAGEPEDDADRAWIDVTLADVRAALAEVGANFRRVYEMHVFEHRSYEQIAAALGISRVTVGTRLNRARHRLRAALCARMTTGSAQSGRSAASCKSRKRTASLSAELRGVTT
jgi:RNA polymerase sigma-70 factor, ECF subfamily